MDKYSKTKSRHTVSTIANIRTSIQFSSTINYNYNTTTVKQVAYIKLARWYNDVKNTVLKQFSTVINTLSINYKTILNYFNNRNTNASAESFNAKIKSFRAKFRGVRDTNFFLYRLTKLYT